MQTAVLHSATRVIRRVTVDPSPTVASDEIAVVVAGPDLDIGNGPWKLDADNVTKTRPTQQEVDDADVDPVRVSALQRQFLTNYLSLVDAIAAATTNAQMQSALKAWAPAHRKLVNGIFR